VLGRGEGVVPRIREDDRVPRCGGDLRDPRAHGAGAEHADEGDGGDGGEKLSPSSFFTNSSPPSSISRGVRLILLAAARTWRIFKSDFISITSPRKLSKILFANNGGIAKPSKGPASFI
jgi:hypothetical protein